MASIKDVKAKILKDICDLLDCLEPSGESSKIYKERFAEMSDKEFIQYMNWWFEDEANDRLKISVLEFERNISVDNIVKASELINVPLYETVAMPDLNGSATENIVCTPTKVPVGYIQPKRMPQTVYKKTTGSISDSKRNPKTGQVTGDDKNARNSDTETYALLCIGAENTLKELMGPRGDDLKMAAQMKQQIASTGFCSLNDLDSRRVNKPSLNMLDTYFRLMGMTTNMVYPPDYIPSADDEDILK